VCGGCGGKKVAKLTTNREGAVAYFGVSTSQLEVKDN